MPVELRSIFGKADYAVVQALQELTGVVNTLEAMTMRLQASVTVLEAHAAALATRLASLEQQFAADRATRVTDVGEVV